MRFTAAHFHGVCRNGSGGGVRIMLEAIGQWLTGITCAALVAALAERLTPPGPVRRVGRFTTGLVLLLAMLSPLLPLRGETLARALSQYRLELDGYRQELAGESREAMKSIIEEQCAAYIQDKAETLGSECSVEVDAEESGGWPVPRRVTVSGPLTEEQQAELTALIEAELAVPAEEQNYQIQEEP